MRSERAPEGLNFMDLFFCPLLCRQEVGQNGFLGVKETSINVGPVLSSLLENVS